MHSIISLISVIRSDSRVFERLGLPGISRVVNHGLRHVFQSASVSSFDGPVSNFFTSGIP
jgi:hypothetical protein